MKTFNCGVGFCLILPRKNIDKVKKRISSKKINFHEKIFDLTKILSNTDFYLGSASSIIYELNYLKIPSVIMTLNKKQKKIDNRFFENLGNFFILDIKDLKYQNLCYLINLILINLKNINQSIKVRKIDIGKNGAQNIFNAITKKSKIKNFKNKIKAHKNKALYQIAKIDDVNEFLNIRNRIKNRESSLTSNQIEKIDHYIWWLNKRIDKFKFTSENKIKITLWRKKILIKNKYFYTGGWSTSDKVSINEIIFAYKKLLDTKNFKWIGVAKKENRFLTWLNLRLGFNIFKGNNFSSQIKSFIKLYKIKKPKNLNFFIN